MDTGFEFKYVVKAKIIDDGVNVLVLDSIKWDEAVKKVITVQIDERTTEKLHEAKIVARNIIIEKLNDEHGVGNWKFFD